LPKIKKLKPKKTLSSRLATRFKLILRNEESLAEHHTINITGSKVILFSAILFVVMLVFSLFLSKTILARWFDPEYANAEANRALFVLSRKVDSLAIEVERKDQFIANFQRVLSGDTATFEDPAEALRNQEKPLGVKPEELKLKLTDSLFRKNFEQSDLALIANAGSTKFSELKQMYFFTPIAGFVSDRYDAKKGHLGVDIVAKTNEPVKSIADGMVIFSELTRDGGHIVMIQHQANLISVYKHNSYVYKKVGTFVNAGDIIAIVGNSGELTNGPHLHFELWYNGTSLNPEEFVTF
jgi:murein DD-endopeptidase MepM/ murein hydrolase activator NlpD